MQSFEFLFLVTIWFVILGVITHRADMPLTQGSVQTSIEYMYNAMRMFPEITDLLEAGEFS